MCKFLIAITPAVLMTAVADAQWWWPPTACTVEPPNPTTLDTATITLGGGWPHTCTPNASNTTLLGSTIYVDVHQNYPPGTFCLYMITPWKVTETVGPLPLGSYDLIATLYEGPIPVGSPTSVCTIVVSAPEPECAPVGGLICDDTIWRTEASPYCAASSIIVGCGATLTIEPGVRVCFPRGLFGLAVGSGAFGEGTLVAQGTQDAKIIFTSCEPDAKPGDWVSLNFTEAASDAVFDDDGNYIGGTVLEHVVVAYAGAANAPALTATASSPYIARTSIQDVASGGIFAARPVGAPIPTAIRIEGCDLTNRVSESGVGGTGIELWDTPALVESNTITGFVMGGLRVYLDKSVEVAVTGNTIRGNNRGFQAGVYVRGSGGGSVTLMGNTIVGNAGSGIVLDTVFEPSMVTGNRIIGNASGGIELFSSRMIELVGNVILRNISGDSGGGVSLRSNSSAGIRDCVIANNSSVGASGAGGIGAWGSRLTLAGAPNGGAVVLLGNSGFDIVNENAFGPAENNILAEEVWWGTRNADEIDGRIWDFFDNATRAIVDWEPPGTTGPFDFTDDGEILSDDLGPFVDCLDGPGAAVAKGCSKGDLDRDEDADLFDFAALQTVLRVDSP